MSEPTLDLHALTARYFDGELSASEEEQALEHLAQCAQCQAELGDLVGLEVALQRKPEATLGAAPWRSSPAAPEPSPRLPATAPETSTLAAPSSADEVSRARERRTGVRRFLPAAAVGALAAAAAIVFWLRAAPSVEPAAPQLALAPSRGVEARFSSPLFAAHRPYEVVRGGAGREPLSLTTLVELERRDDRMALVAAQALRGEVDTAHEVLQAAPVTAGRESDRAALELMAGRPEQALDAADRALRLDPRSPSALWNRALSLRELGLPLVAAGVFDELGRRGEAGWSQEASAKAAALRAAMAERAPRAAAFTAAARAMVEHSGPPLSAADVEAKPGLARLYFYDALRGAATVEEARSLAPLAAALDAAVGNQLAQSVLAKVSGADFVIRGPLALAYRELAQGRAAGTAPALWARLAKAKTYVEDQRLGVALLWQGGVPFSVMEQLIAATGDPWFSLHLPREAAKISLAEGAPDRAELQLRTALAECDERLWAFRCARLAYELAALYTTQTRYQEAESQTVAAIRLFRQAGATELEDSLLSPLAEGLRARGRFSLSAATFQEVIARLTTSDCYATRYARSGLALLEIYLDASLRSQVPPDAEECQQPPTAVELGAMVDLARMTGRPEDRGRAERWIAASRGAGDPLLGLIAEVAEARLSFDGQPEGAQQLAGFLPKLAGDDETRRAFRAWIYQTLVEGAARRGDWREAMALVARDLGAEAPSSCALAVSLDDQHSAAVALDAKGAYHGARKSVAAPSAWRETAPVPEELHRSLAGCSRIAVLARAPLHGRADLMPPQLPWAFLGARAVAPPASAVRRELFVGDALPPPALTLPALAPMPSHPPVAPEQGAVSELRGVAATPAAVLAALAAATYAELHVHGQVDLGVADASFLALSPGADQRWALTAAEVRTAKLSAAPVIVLAACRAAAVAPFEHKRWSLPDAFLEAGARAVIAPTVEVPDSEAAAFFAELRGRLAAGEEPAVALAALRRAYLAGGAAWAGSIILFN